MRSPNQTLQCTIHHVEYPAFHCSKTNTATSCPLCMEERYHEIHDQLDEAKEHRDILLSVIELKSTQIDCENDEMTSPRPKPKDHE